ncbi:unnamed protein product (macronuclear) [Paramecium tetraurelia]|uniref:FCP1 homology domain-containing protein n=1 Tax=Paramecium tetraurelia TaxID=5888 RepID=A0DZG6_PARTE|nr:uncharacterized protein GSPATT00021600001 [Paramecium tetraurelia]CAK88433.1 unnamed protein product [Paramecium tetraurelia]|eukprot:XP_001455830.1 hypothetical protein (macronuclear) [Paramecium tetraurelia strain d4-2]
MQNNKIIYSKTQEKRSFLSSLCSCFDCFKKNPQQMNQYHPEIDTPKSSFIGQRKIIVLDLDETLVHSQFEYFDSFDFTINIAVQSQNFKVYVIVRPGVKKFIEQLNHFYDIIFWTASIKEYAMAVIDYIDPDGKAVERLFRDSCTPLKNSFTKDLTKLGRDLKDVIIVDNSVFSFIMNPENGLKINDFFYDKYDKELESILPFLIWISQLSDLRPIQNRYKEFLNRKKLEKKNDEQQIIYGLSKTVSIQRKKINQKSFIKTLTEHIANRGKVGKDDTNESEKETFEIINSY